MPKDRQTTSGYAGRRRRALAALTAGALGIAGAALGNVPALAADANVVDRPAGAVTADGLPTAQINGVAWDLAIVGDWVYAGGQFTTARPAGAAAGVSTVPRSNLMAFNIRTGVMTSWAPTTNGVVRRLAVSPDKKRLYVGGDFTTVNGLARSRVAAFDVSANNGLGTLVSGFAPAASSAVYALAATNTTVYLGGFFNSVNGVARTNLAAVQASNGATTSWIANAGGGLPRSIALTADQSRLIVAGQFSSINGVSALGLGAVSASTGQVLSFAANQVVHNYGTKAGFYSVRSDSTNVYVTGWNFGGTGNFEGMLVADPTSGAIKSMQDCHGDTYDASPMNTVVYTVSHHHHCSNIGGFPDTNPRTRWQRTDGVTMAATTTVRHNDQSGFADFFGRPAPSMLSWFPDVAVGSFTGQAQGGWSTAATSQYLVQGGEFPAVNNQAQQGLVRFAIPSLAPKKQGMRATTAESAPTLQQLTTSSVKVSWLSNYDRDDQRLTYKLYRGTTLITTTTGVSQFWNRPTLTYTDTGLAPGTYTYKVVASDPDGNTQTSDSKTITVSATVNNTLASDNFSRTGAGWGTADVGGAWTDSGGSNFTTNGSAGLLNLKAGSGPYAYLNSVSSANVTSTVAFSANKIPNGNGGYVMLTARRTASAEYQVRAQLLANGSVKLVVVSLVNGVESQLASTTVAGLSYTANTSLNLKMSVTGSPTATITGKLWRTGSAEPAQAQVTVSNSNSALQGSGAVGVRTYLSGGATNGPITVSFDNFSSVRPA